MVGIELVYCARHLSDSGYFINIPHCAYFEGVVPNDFADSIYQSVADSHGLTVVTADRIFKPEVGLDIDFLKWPGGKVHSVYKSLKEGPKKTKDLMSILGLSQPAVSSRMNQLLKSGLVVKLNAFWTIPKDRLKILKMIEEKDYVV